MKAEEFEKAMARARARAKEAVDKRITDPITADQIRDEIRAFDMAAAAPQLLAALEALTAEAASVEGPWITDATFDAALAAIKLAKEGTPS